MNAYIVVCEFAPDVQWAQVTTMVAEEQVAAQALRDEGSLTAIRVSIARDKVFLEVQAEDADAALEVTRRLPRSVFWSLETYQIAVPM